MSQMLIQRETLVGIADAIREKSGTTDSIPVPELAAKIMAIESSVVEELEEYDGKNVRIE